MCLSECICCIVLVRMCLLDNVSACVFIRMCVVSLCVLECVFHVCLECVFRMCWFVCVD